MAEKDTVFSSNIKYKGVFSFSDFYNFCYSWLTEETGLEVKISIKVLGLEKVEISENGKKIQTNKGSISLKVKGDLVKDYDGKFEGNAFRKFLRGVYEKWVISSRVDQYQDKLAGACNEFLAQSKAYLDLEGKK